MSKSTQCVWFLSILSAVRWFCVTDTPLWFLSVVGPFATILHLSSEVNSSLLPISHSFGGCYSHLWFILSYYSLFGLHSYLTWVSFLRRKQQFKTGFWHQSMNFFRHVAETAMIEPCGKEEDMAAHVKHHSFPGGPSHKFILCSGWGLHRWTPTSRQYPFLSEVNIPWSIYCFWPPSPQLSYSKPPTNTYCVWVCAWVCACMVGGV